MLNADVNPKLSSASETAYPKAGQGVQGIIYHTYRGRNMHKLQRNTLHENV